MTMSSYQTIARYDDCSQRTRARCTNDIRQRQREALSQSRFRERCLVMLQNRKSLTQFLGSSDFYGQYSETGDCVDGDNYSSTQLETSWYILPSTQWNQQARSEASSPTLSCNSEYSVPSHNSDDCNNVNEIYDSLLKEFSSQVNHRFYNNCPKSRKQLLKMRKQSLLSCYDVDKIRQELTNLKNYTLTYKDKGHLLNCIVSAGWKAIADAIQAPDPELSRDCLTFLNQVVTNQIIDSETILYILQQGVIFSLRDAFSRLGEQPAVLELLISIIRSEPRSAAFIVEMLSNTQILNLIDESFCMGTNEEAKLAFELYGLLFSITMSASVSDELHYNPIIPRILLQTGLTKEISESYSPVATLKKLVRISLIEPVIMRYFSQRTVIEKDMIQPASAILANCLEFISLQASSSIYDASWTDTVLSPFRHLQFGRSIEVLISSGSTDPIQDDLKRLLVFYNQFLEVMSPFLDAI